MAKDKDLKETFDLDFPTEGRSFDELAKDIANGTLSRGPVLKLVGAAIFGSVLSSALQGIAVAKKKKKKKKKKHHRTQQKLPCTISSCTAGQVCLSNGTCVKPCGGADCFFNACGFAPCGCFCARKFCGYIPPSQSSSCSTDMDCSLGYFCDDGFCQYAC